MASFLARLNPEDQRNKTCLSVFACLAGACFIFTIVRAYGFLHVCLKCAEHLHDKMVVAILESPVLFLDSNPMGIILNRFPNDICRVDDICNADALRDICPNSGNSCHKCLAL